MGKPWTTAEIQKLVQMRQSRWTVAQISAELGRSKDSIYNRLRVYGIRKPPSREKNMEIDLRTKARLEAWDDDKLNIVLNNMRLLDMIVEDFTISTYSDDGKAEIILRTKKKSPPEAAPTDEQKGPQ